MNNNDKLIELLNEALQAECYDILLYHREADIIKEKEREISKKFETFGRMELRHADNISMQILILGGKPKWEFIPLSVKKSIKEMLETHLGREEKGIKMYSSLIDFLGEGNEQLKLIIKGIKSEEEGHFAAIKELIERYKKR